MFSPTVFAVLAIASSVHAHMELSFPPPLRSKFNPHAVSSSIDYSMTSPLAGDGSNFPCKGYQTDMADATGAGMSVATFNAGSSYNFTVDGGAPHGGGSCQVALSYDQGKTMKVIHSYIGSCPLSSGQSFDFTVPSDAKTGSAMFVWNWYNMIGNREIYQNCASVTIAGGSSSKSRAAPAVAFADRPDLFVANLGNGCTTVESKEVLFPNPGPSADVTTKQTVTDDSGSFTGTCAAVKGIGGESASSGSTGSTGASGSSAAPAASAASTESSAQAATPTASATSVISIQIIPTSDATPSVSASASATGFVTSSAAASVTPVASSAAPASTGTTSSGSVLPSKDGLCGGSQTCSNSGWGHCCSSAGFCGVGDAWCGTGCQSAFGECGAFTNSTSSAAVRRLRMFRG